MEIINKGCGILGFVKFLKGYYLVVMTQKKKVAKIGFHDIFQIKDIKMVPLFTWGRGKLRLDEETKYCQLFMQIKINEGFFFSYTYDLTHTLQSNMVNKIKRTDNSDQSTQGEGDFMEAAEESVDSEEEENLNLRKSASSRDPGEGEPGARASMRKQLASHGIQEKWLKEHKPFESMFLWNHFLIKDFYRSLVKKKWVMPVIYGDLSSVNFRSDTKNCTFVLISRRSRRYAGTRYMKRGINEHGCVANSVEVEQICFVNNDQFDIKPQITSFVQIRGSIPLFWQQVPNL